MAKKKYRLALADDQLLFRQGLRNLLEKNSDFKVIAEAENGVQLLKQMQAEEPDIVLLDLEMPEMDGAEATEKIVKKYPNVKIIVLSMYNDECLMARLISLGAHGYLTKDNAIETVMEAVRAVGERGFYFSEAVLNAMAKKMYKPSNKVAAPGDELTAREIEIIELICQQLTNKEIGDKLSISDRTVSTHRTSILVKTNSKNTAGIVMYAIEHDLLKKKQS